MHTSFMQFSSQLDRLPKHRKILKILKGTSHKNRKYTKTNMTRILNNLSSILVLSSISFQPTFAFVAGGVGGGAAFVRTTGGTANTFATQPSSSPTVQRQKRRNTSVHQQHSHKIVELLMSDILPSMSSVPENTHILILPGFSTSTDDYTKKGSLKPNLMNRGWSNENVHVLPVEKHDWFTNTIFQGMILRAYDFFNSQIKPNSPAYSWYLNRVASEIERIDQSVKSQHGPNAKAKVILVGHSAGGWLARAAIGYGCNGSSTTTDNDGIKRIDIDNVLGIVTLGSPHIPSPIAGKNVDITGGALRYTNERFPGAYHSDKMFYVTTAGNAIEGSSTSASTMKHRLAYHSYKQVSGEGKLVGDGIVPTGTAHLDGADAQINLDNVYHAPELVSKSSKDGNTNNDCDSEAWYGSDNILDEWFRPVLGVLEQRLQQLELKETAATTKFATIC